MSFAYNNSVHPHKLNLWLALVCIAMFFIGFVCVYLMLPAPSIGLPQSCWSSTAAIVLSGLTMNGSVMAFKRRQMKLHQLWLMITGLLGLIFILLQVVAFEQVYHWGIIAIHDGAASVLCVMAGAHLLYVITGLGVLVSSLIRVHRRRVVLYSATGLEETAIYWYFVDALWLGLFIFLLLV
jgi:cytochrome c oxidase subunit 3